MMTNDSVLIRKASPWILGVFAGLAFVLGLLALAMPFFQANTAGDWALTVLLISLPAGLVAWYCGSAFTRLRRTLVRVDGEGVFLRIADWKCGLLLGRDEVQLRWPEVQRVTFVRQVYGRGAITDEWGIHTTRGLFVLTDTVCPRSAEVAERIAVRAGLAIENPSPAVKSGAPALTPGQKVKVTLLFVVLAGALPALLFAFEDTPAVTMFLTAATILSVVSTLIWMIVTMIGFARLALEQMRARR